MTVFSQLLDPIPVVIVFVRVHPLRAGNVRARVPRWGWW